MVSILTKSSVIFESNVKSFIEQIIVLYKYLCKLKSKTIWKWTNVIISQGIGSNNVIFEYLSACDSR